MCWYFCSSLRGAVYFGASVHIFVGFLFLMVLGFHCYVSIFVNDNLLTNPTLLIGAILLTIYGILFLMFGCLIFRGVEKRSLTLLKFSTVGVTILQLLFFIVILVLYFVLPQEAPALNEFQKFLFLGIFCFGFVASVNYAIILILYVRKLWRCKVRGNEDQSNINCGTNSPQAASNIGSSRISPPLMQEPIYSGSTYRAKGVSSHAGGSTMTSPSGSGAYYRNNPPSVYNEDPLTRQPFLSRESQLTNQSFPMYRYPLHFRSNAPSEQGDREDNLETNWDQPRIHYQHGHTQTTYRDSPISSPGIYSGPSSTLSSNRYDPFMRQNNHSINTATTQ